MTKVLQVFKFSAAGNDFVLVDLRTPNNRWLAKSHRANIARRLSLEFAADGVLFLFSVSNAPRTTHHATRLVFHNPDGSRAFCGNGTRTAGYYEVSQIQKKRNGKISVLTDAGKIAVAVRGTQAALLDVEAPKFLGQCRINLFLNSKNSVLRPTTSHLTTFYKVWSGCPHAITFVSNLGKVDVDVLGRKTRWDRHFAGQGTNVDFVKVLNKTTFEMRTYERGVEKETASCGSGVLAAGLLMKRLNRLQGDNFLCKMRGGDFKIGFDNQGRMELTSQVKKVFQGVCYV